MASCARGGNVVKIRGRNLRKPALYNDSVRWQPGPAWSRIRPSAPSVSSFRYLSGKAEAAPLSVWKTSHFALRYQGVPCFPKRASQLCTGKAKTQNLEKSGAQPATPRSVDFTSTTSACNLYTFAHVDRFEIP